MRSSRRLSWLGLALAAVMAWGTADADSFKVGFVDAARVLEEAPQLDQVRQKLEDEFGERDQELVARQQEIRELEQRLARDGAIMNQQQRRSLEREVTALKREFSRSQEAFSEDLNIRRNELFSELQGEVRQTVEALAQDQGFDLVVSDGVVFASERIDITEKVLEELRNQNRRR